MSKNAGVPKDELKASRELMFDATSWYIPIGVFTFQFEQQIPFLHRNPIS